ncbi:unnamed protein product, partial [Oikopleura dioica]
NVLSFLNYFYDLVYADDISNNNDNKTSDGPAIRISARFRSCNGLSESSQRFSMRNPTVTASRLLRLATLFLPD